MGIERETLMVRIFLTLVILAALAGPRAWAENEPETVVLQLKWFHQFQFAGYYAAEEQGYYREAGLSVEIREGNPRTDAVKEILAGRAQYGVSNSEVLLRRLRGDPVVVLAAIFQHSPLVFVAVEGSGIRHPQDMIGRRVGVSKSTRDAELLAMLHNEGISLDDIQPPKGGQFNAAMYYDGSADAGSAYLTNEPFYLEEKNIPYRVLHPLTYGIDFYGDCLITSETELGKHPDRVERFREASLRGWEYAMAHPEATVDLILKRYGSQKNRAHLLYEAEKMAELILPKLVEMGHMNPGRWRHIADTFVKLKMAPPDYDLDGFMYDPNPGKNLIQVRRFVLILLLVVAAAAVGLFTLFYFNRRLRREVLDRKLAEKTLRFQAELMEQIQDVIVAADTAGRIVYVNEAAVRTTEKTREELMNGDVHMFDLADTPRTTQEILQKTLSDGSWRGRVINRLPDGSARVLESRTWLSRDPDGKPSGIVGVSTDISERERMAEDLRAARDAADAANRAKSQFLANMSHEIRTPMNAILGFSEILLARAEDPRTKTYLSSIHSSGKALLALIDDILDLSKIEAGKMDISPAPVVVRSLMEEIGAMFSQKADENGLGLDVVIPDDFPRVLLLDELRLRQILVNLMGNAVKFTHKGSIRLCVHEHRRTDDAATRSRDRLDIAFEVEDTGVGIPKDQQKSVFEPFRKQSAQKPAEYNGTGLGLAITRSLVSLMGGEISLESEAGAGAVFRIMLPGVVVAEGPLPPEPACEFEQFKIHFPRATVLLVDDVSLNRELIQGFLEGHDLTMFEAESGERALQLLGIDAPHPAGSPPMPRPDVIFMDIRMPSMDGYETAMRIKENDPFKTVPIIAFTASAMKEEKERALSIFDGYIRKPAGAADILEALKAHLPCGPTPAGAAIADRPDAEALPLGAPGRPPEIMDRVENELLPEWREIMDLFFIDDVADFARKVDRLAAEYDIEPLSDYARKLLENAKRLDVEGMNRLMSDFERVVDELHHPRRILPNG